MTNIKLKISYKTAAGRFALPAAALSCMLYSLVFPQPAAASALRALRLCGGAVIPSLFMFIVAARLLAGCGISDMLAAAERPKRLLGVSGGGLLVIFTGLISGYPGGAQTAAELCKKGRMDTREASELLPFTNNAGPAFLVGAVGAGMFSDVKIGAILLSAQTLSSLLLIFLTRKRRLEYIGGNYIPERKNINIASLVSSSVAQGGLTMVAICAFVVFFTVISDALAFALAEIGIESAFIFSVLRGFFEITSGLYDAGRFCASSPAVAVAISGVLVGFSGLSVMMQVSDRAGDLFSAARYLSGKVASGMFCGVISLILYFLFCAKSIKTGVFVVIFFLLFVFVFIMAKKLFKKGRKIKSYDI